MQPVQSTENFDLGSTNFEFSHPPLIIFLLYDNPLLSDEETDKFADFRPRHVIIKSEFFFILGTEFSTRGTVIVPVEHGHRVGEFPTIFPPTITFFFPGFDDEYTLTDRLKVFEMIL